MCSAALSCNKVSLVQSPLSIRSTTVTLVVIDSQVAHAETLASEAVNSATVFVLQGDRDGIEQITDILKSYSELAQPIALHIVAHGSPGTLLLGNTQLSLDTLDGYAEQLRGCFFEASTFENSGIYLYGCQVALGDAGTEFVEKLHGLTGVAIAASTQPIGNGNWQLDIQTGSIPNPEANIPFSASILESYTETFALGFDGLNDYTTAPSTGVNLANSSFTIELWAQRSRTNTEEYLVSIGTNETANNILHIGFRDTNQFTASFFGGNDLNTTATYTDADWHHYAVTYDATTNQRTIYRDGVQVAQDIAPADFQGSGAIELGRLSSSTTPSNYFQGSMDDVRIWNTVRTEAQIQANLYRQFGPSTTGLLANWQFNEGTGTTSSDLSGGDNTVTLVNGVTWTASSPLPTHFDVSTVLNIDAIVNNAGTVDTTQTSIDLQNNALLTQAFAVGVGPATANGLPNDGFFAANTFHPDIQLAYRNSDDGNNARLLTSAGSFTFNVPANNYKDIHLAVTSTQGNSDVRLTLNYSDGTSVPTTVQAVPDWFSSITESPSVYYLIDGMDRVRANSTIYEDANTFAVFGVRFAADPTKTLQSVTVEKTSATGQLVFLGATGVVNATPTDISISASTVAENSANGTVVGTLNTVDSNIGDTHTYSLIDDAGGRFSISGNQLVVANGSLLNFEALDSHVVQVRTTDANGLFFDESFTISLTDANDAPTGTVSITGSLTEGQELTANTTTLADEDDLGAFSYQWQQSSDGTTWNNITGATQSTFTPNDPQVNQLLRVQVFYSDGGGNATTVTSAATMMIASINDTPTGLPTISGTTTEGQVLTAATGGIADADGLSTFSYQWQQSADSGTTWTNISGATLATFTPDDAQVGQLVRVQVSYLDGQGTTETLSSAATAAIANVNDSPIGAPTVTGTPTEGQVLTADTTRRFGARWLYLSVATVGRWRHYLEQYCRSHQRYLHPG